MSGLAVALDLHAPKLSRVEAEDLMRRAHVDGTPLGESDSTKNRTSGAAEVRRS